MFKETNKHTNNPYLMVYVSREHPARILARTFRGQAAERPQQLGETQVVFAGHSLGVVAAQHRHHGHKRVLDELLHGLGTPSHGGSRAPSASSASNRNKAPASEF